MLIGTREIGHGEPPFIIAEAAFNHNGDVLRALEMVNIAHWAKADAIKFQTYHAEEFCHPDDPIYDAFKAGELPDDAWAKIKARCDKLGIIFLSTPQNPCDLDLLLTVGMPVVKIGSDDLTNIPMLQYCARDDVGLPIILSCGMATNHDLICALAAVGKRKAAILVCTSQYPCPAEEANLARISTLRSVFPSIPIGFSDHTMGIQGATIAATLGACIFETHFTLDPKLPGPDHSWVCDPSQLYEWVEAIRRTPVMLGNGIVEPSAREAEQRAKYQRRPGQQLRGHEPA